MCIDLTEMLWKELFKEGDKVLEKIVSEVLVTTLVAAIIDALHRGIMIRGPFELIFQIAAHKLA
jgi:hypothetical protein